MMIIAILIYLLLAQSRSGLSHVTNLKNDHKFTILIFNWFFYFYYNYSRCKVVIIVVHPGLFIIMIVFFKIVLSIGAHPTAQHHIESNQIKSNQIKSNQIVNLPTGQGPLCLTLIFLPIHLAFFRSHLEL